MSAFKIIKSSLILGGRYHLKNSKNNILARVVFAISTLMLKLDFNTKVGASGFRKLKKINTYFI